MRLMQYCAWLRFASLGIMGLSCWSGQVAHAVNIAWVSIHPSGASSGQPSTAAAGIGFTQAPDIGYTNLLTANGHTVTRFTSIDGITAASQLVTDLNSPSIDLVILGRSNASGHYEQDAEIAVWNESVVKPMIIMNAFIARGARLGFFETNDTNTLDMTANAKLKLEVPGHPIFNGVSLDAGNVMVNDFIGALPSLPFAPNTPQRGASVVNRAIDASGTIIATVNNGTGATFASIAEFPQGATITNPGTAAPATDNVIVGPRLIFFSGSREHAAPPTSSADIAGIFDLTPDGTTLFLNSIDYLLGQAKQPGDVNEDGDVDMDDFNTIKNNFQKTVAGRSFGDLTGDLKVDWLDFRQWKNFFPFTPPPATAASGAVPEPGSAVLALTASSVLLGVGRSIRRRCA
jgi:hypothetical protein